MVVPRPVQPLKNSVVERSGELLPPLRMHRWLSPSALFLFPLIPSYEGRQGRGKESPVSPLPPPTVGPPPLFMQITMMGFLKPREAAQMSRLHCSWV